VFSRCFPACLTCFALWCAAGAAHAQDDGTRGIWLARQGRCEQAIPLLEQSELTGHRPPVMLALGDCHLKLGDLLAARDTYKALGDETPNAHSWGADIQAINAAKRKARETEDRIPTVRFELPDGYVQLEVRVDDKIVDPSKPIRLNPDITAHVSAKAKGFRKWEKDVTLSERERLVLELRMERGGKGTGEEPGDAKPAPQKPKPDIPATHWLGVQGRAFIMPKFLMNTVVEGGRTALFPGGGVQYTRATPGFDLVVSLDAISYRTPAMPIKQRGAPDTDYEIVDSNLVGLQAEVALLWASALDDAGRWSFRWGLGLGFGYMIAGALRRSQAFPPSGKQGDPYGYQACSGPNDPPGSFEYCNALDKDASHYRYSEPDWFHGGKRPALYPWLALPKLGLSWKPVDEAAFDLDAGFSLGGFYLGLGARMHL
jgi:hypothetical protein